MRRTAALIVGGGPAGSAAAITLARAGAPPLMLERTRETGDALCGGFLSWRSLRQLDALGIAANTLNPRRIARVRILAGGRSVEAALPAPALAVSRRRLDTVLLDAAVAAGARVERGVTVRAVEESHVRTADGATLTPETLFLASGKHDVRGLARPEAARGRDPTLGLRVRIRPSSTIAKRVGDAVELHLFPGGYAGVALQEDGSLNLCLAVHRSAMQAAGGPAALLRALGATCPALGERLAGWDGTPPDAVANVPYGWRARASDPRTFRLGDQAGVIPSLAGEGMGIGLASGRSAALSHLGGQDGADWQPRFARALARPVGTASLLRTLAESRLAATLVPLLPARLIHLAADLTRIDDAA